LNTSLVELPQRLPAALSFACSIQELLASIRLSNSLLRPLIV